MKSDNQVYIKFAGLVVAVLLCGLLSSCANQLSVKYKYFDKKGKDKVEQDTDSILGIRPYSIF